jgi:hypothetical protein
MRWGRGFFRLWLFFSAIWIAVSVYAYGPTTYQFWRAPILEFESPSGQRFLVDSSKSREEIHTQIVAVLEREAKLAAEAKAKFGMFADIPKAKTESTTLPPDYVLDQYGNETRDELLTFIETKVEEARSASQRAWLTTLVPPLVLLGLGLCLGWIVRGFRPQKPGPAG